jgi:hypothetical protein
MNARTSGEQVAEWLAGPPASGVAFGVGECGVRAIDE